MTHFTVVGNAGTLALPWPINGAHAIHAAEAARLVNLSDHSHGGPGQAAWETMCEEAARLTREKARRRDASRGRLDRRMAPQERCCATTRAGTSCRFRRMKDHPMCRRHRRISEQGRDAHDRESHDRDRARWKKRAEILRERRRVVNITLAEHGKPPLKKRDVASLEQAEALAADLKGA